MRIFYVLALLLMCCGPVAAEEMRPRISILPFDSALSRQYDGLKDGMADILTACYTAYADRAEILDRSELEGITAETVQNFNVKNIKLKSATHLLRGSLAPHEDGLTITLMLYDLAAAKLVASADASGGKGDITRVACQAVGSLTEKLDSIKQETGGDATPDAEEHGKLMLEGMGFYYNGAYDKALPAYMKLLKEDPDNATALYWLGKSYRAAGMDDAAAIEFKKFAEKFPGDPRSMEIKSYLGPSKEKSK